MLMKGPFCLIILQWRVRLFESLVKHCKELEAERSYHEEAFTQLQVTHHLELFKLVLQSIGLLVLYVVVRVIVGVVAQCVIGSEAWRTGGGETVGDWGGRGTARVVGRTSAAVRAHRNLERAVKQNVYKIIKMIRLGYACDSYNKRTVEFV